MAKRNTYGEGRRMSKKKRTVLIRRWTLLVLVAAIIVGGIAVIVKMAKSGDNENNTVKPSIVPTMTATMEPTPIPTPIGSIGPDKAVSVTGIPTGAPTLQPTLNPNSTNMPNAAVTASATNSELSTNLLDTINQMQHDGVKIAYLTFDDGPTKSVTPRILDTLRKYNIKATFFQIGSGIESNPDMARRVYEEGHLIANHSYAHEYSKLYASEESFMTEILNTENMIKQVTGQDEIFKLFRFPGGSYKSSQDSWSSNKQKYKETLKQNGYYYCDWNSLNGDAEGGKRRKTKEELVEEVKTTIKSKGELKEDVVILMHDAAAKSTTADALPEICEYLIEQGYQFKRLDEINK